MSRSQLHNNIVKAFEIYKAYNRLVVDIRSMDSKRLRCMNFPELISEYIVYLILSQMKEITREVTAGDLKEKINGVFERVEVKCTTGRGPISFGPKESWTKLYILRVKSGEISDRYSLFCIDASNDSPEWQNIKISRKETFEDQAIQGRRPRISFDALRKEIKMETISRGRIQDLLKMI